jgi:hypothetical protein
MALAAGSPAQAQTPLVIQQAEVVTAPRSAAAQPLLFNFVSNLAGYDTEITISNTSLDTLGSTSQAGTCTLNYYGVSAPAQQTTSSIAAGKQLVINVSQGGGGVAAAPGFDGYIIANCTFPLARGYAKVFLSGTLAAGYDAQIVTLPRSTSKPQNFLFPFVTNQAGYDTGFAIANTSQDPFGTVTNAGTCTLNFYGNGAPTPNTVTTSNIPAGTVDAFTLSSIAPGFQGYVIAQCNFYAASTWAFVSNVGTGGVSTLAETAEQVSLPRNTTAQPLLFPAVINQNGQDTGIAIANTTSDPFGSSPAAGTCTLNFYGSGAPGTPVTTPSIASGSVYAATLSSLAPGFKGYLTATCAFAEARGFSFVVSNTGPPTDGDAVMPEVVTTPRSTTNASLVFSAASNWNGNDTTITILNTSADSFGTAASAGTCTLSYYGSMVNGGPTPAQQVTNSIAAGGGLSFSLSQGNAAQGISATPGFRGYIIAGCNFPQARGIASIAGNPQGDTVNVTVNTVPANLLFDADGITYTAPKTFAWIPGSIHSLSADADTSHNRGFTFSSWSDTGTASHSITTPSVNETLTSTLSPCAFNFSPGTGSEPAAGGPNSVSYTVSPANCPWGVNSTASWLTITNATGSPAAGTIFYNAGANTGAARSAQLQFTNVPAANPSAVFSTNQAAAAGALAIANNSNLGTFTIGQIIYTLNASGGTGNYTWSVTPGFALPPGLNIAQNPNSQTPQPAIVGIATAPGNYSFSLTLNDGNTSATQIFTARITALTVKDNNLPDAFEKSVYSHTFTALNNAGAVTFNPTSPLPAWLSLSPGGTLSGTPPAGAHGNYQINFSVFDGTDTSFRSYQLTVYAVNLTTAGALPNATQGVAYSQPLSASGGSGAGYTYAITGGSLPFGLSLNNGAISGTTTVNTGIYGFYVTVTDSGNNSYQKAMSIDVVGTSAQTQVTLGPIDDPIVGNSYGWQIPTCCGGVAPFTWTAAGLPPGMSIRYGSGVTSDYIYPGWGEIWGVASTPGTYNVTVTVTDVNNNSSSLKFPLHVSVLNVAPGYNLPNASVLANYSTTFQVIGGTPGYLSVNQISGYLPNGLTLNTATLATANTYTVSGNAFESGGFDPVFQITDSAGNTLTRNNYFNINNGPNSLSINNGPNLGTVTAGSNFSVQVSACCAASYSWVIASGNVPSGLTINATTGLLSGTLNVPGNYSFVVGVNDVSGAQQGAFRRFYLTVTPLAITTPGPLHYGNLGTTYNVGFTATGGTGTLTWSVAYGTYLPPGLTLSSSGALSGTPTATGQYNFGVTVTDQNNNTATNYYGINIYAAGAYPPVTFGVGPNFGTWHIGTDWIALNANGGNGTYTWSLIPVQGQTGLPPGLALRTDVPSFFPANAQAGIIGVATTPGTYTFTLGLTSAGQPVIQQSFTIRISQLDLQDAAPPDGFVNTPYTNYQFTPIGNAGPVTFSLNTNNSTNGALPPGLALSSAGLLTGTPTTAGNYVIAMNIFDGVDNQYEQYNLYVYAIDITTPGLLPVNATQYSSYSAQLNASGGTGTYNWTVSGGLPNGLSLNSTTGVISGTVNSGPGLYGFNVTAADGNVSYSKHMALDVIGSPIAPMEITNRTFNDPVFGDHYGNVQSVCCGGTAPFVWTITGLPPGLTYEPNSNSFLQYPATPGNVQIYGVPQQAGTFNVTYKVTDATNASTSLTVPMHVSLLDVNLPGNYSAYNLPNGIINVPYTSTFHVIGGSGPYSFTETIPELPDGLHVISNTLTVSGTPLENGSNFNAPGFVFTDSAGNSLFRYESIQITGGSTININGNGYYGYNLGTTAVGGFYSTQFSACCVSSYNWSVATGSSLPTGLSLSGSGQLAGTPTVAGSYSFLIQVADANNAANVTFKYFTLTVTPIAITTGSLPYGDVQVGYPTSGTAQLTANGGVGALTWTQVFVQGSQLPPGLTLNADGSITGTPTSAGAYNVTVQATDTAGNIAIRSYVIDIYQSGPPPLNLPLGPTIGPYAEGLLTVQLSASGGTPPYHYSITPGTPPILGLRVQDGQPLPTGFPSNVTGGILAVLSQGFYTTSIRVTDSTNATFDRAINFTVLAVDIVSNPTLPKAVVNTAYSFQLSPVGGNGNYVWSGSNLPAGVSINSGTGVLSGTPTSAGTFNFSVGVADAAGGGSTFRGFTLAVNPFAITDAQILPQATAQKSYSHQFSAPNCGANCAWSVYTGSLPSGLSLSSTGLLSGTPTGGTQTSFGIQAKGANGTSQKQFGLAITPSVIQGLSVTATMVATPILGVPNANQLNAVGGQPPYTFSYTGNLPPGLFVVGTGETLGDLAPGFYYFGGRPTQPGTYNFTLKVTDSANNTATQAYTVSVSNMEFLYTSLPVTLGGVANPLIYNQPYTQALAVAGGNGNYNSWSLVGASTIYPGLTLDPLVGVVSGTPSATGSISTPVQVSDSAGNSVTSFVNVNSASNGTTEVTLNGGPSLNQVIPLLSGQSFNLNPSGGTSPYVISSTAPLPTGFVLTQGNTSLNAGTYNLLVNPETPGTYSFTLVATDFNGVVGARAYTVIVPGFTSLLNSTSIPVQGSVGVPYTYNIIVLDDANTVSFALAPGAALPPGLSLSSTGVISGTPGAAGTYVFNINISDPSGTQTSTFTLTVSPLGISNPLLLPSAVIKVPYSYQMTSTGGAGNWTASNLPPGLSISATGLISGKPQPGVARYTPTITVSNGQASYSARFTLYVGEANPTPIDLEISQTNLPDAIVNQLYSNGFGPIGGVAPFTWAVTPGSNLPPGLALISGQAILNEGVPAGATRLQGQPNQVGTYSFNLTATDNAGSQITRTFTLNVTPVGILSANPPNATVGSLYSFQFSGFGGTPPYTFAISPSQLNQDALPPGLNMTQGGLIGGTPTATGGFSFILKVTDSSGLSYTTTKTLTAFENGYQISTLGNIWSTVGSSWYQGLFVTNPLQGANYNWTLQSGTLPPGLSIQGQALAGVFTSAGTYTFTLRATNSGNSNNFADRQLTYYISPIQVVSPAENSFFQPTLPPGQIGSSYSFQFQAAGGTLPYSYAESSLYPLPPGLQLTPGGKLTGTPSQAGTFTIGFTITDGAGAQHFSTDFTLMIMPAGVNPPLNQLDYDGFNEPSAGVPYAAALDHLITGGTPPYTWSISGGSLPPGMFVQPAANGVSNYLTGIPTASGLYNFTVQVTDSLGQTLTLPGGGLPVAQVAISPASLRPAVTGTPVSITLTASGGTAPYSIQLDPSSAVPPGLTLASSGASTALLAGTPTSPGVFPLIVDITDNNGNSFSWNYDFVIDDPAGESPAIWLSPNPLSIVYPQGTVPAPVSVSVNSTSGNLPYNSDTAALAPAPGNTTAAATVTFPASVATLPTGNSLFLVAVQSPNSVNYGDVLPIVLSAVAPTPCSATYSLTPSSATVPAAGGSGSFGVTAGAGCAWTAVPSDPSITITGSASGTGNGTVNYSVAQNNSANQLNNSIAVANQTYSITQFASSGCSFGLTPAVLNNVPAGGGQAQISVNASLPTCVWPNTSGLNATPNGPGVGSGTATITIPANASANPVNLNATIAGQTVTVNQVGANCTVNLSSGSASFGPGQVNGVVVSVTMPAGCSYNTVGPNWITINSGGSGTSTGAPLPLNFTVQGNSTLVPRSGSLNIGGQTFQISQQAVVCSITTDTTNLNSPFAVGGGNGSINVIANNPNCAWTVTNNSFANVNPSSGVGSGSVGITAGSNAGSALPRNGSVTIATSTVNFSQAGTTCTYSLRSPGATVPAAGGSGTVGVIAAGPCQWTAVSNNTPALTVTSGANGSGTADVAFTVQPNNSPFPQQETLTIAGLTFTVTQAGLPCSFNLAASSALIAGGGAVNQNLSFNSNEPGCIVNPVSYANWITINGFSFNGQSGSLTYTVAANPGGTSRAGTVQIGDQVFTITEQPSTAACTYSLNSHGAAFGQAGGNASFLASAVDGCAAPQVSTNLPTAITLPPTVGPANDIFTQPYTVNVFSSVANAIRKATIVFGGQIFIVKQTSW